MTQEIQTNAKEIMMRLIKLQEDVGYIKEHISLEEETMAWEIASEEDISNWEKENLKNE